MEIFELLKNEKVRIVCGYRWLELSPNGVYRVFERAKYKHAGLVKYRGKSDI